MFGDRREGLGVVHEHRRRLVAHVTHRDVQRGAGVEEVGGAGVAEGVGIGDVNPVAVFVAKVYAFGELRQSDVGLRQGVVPFPVAVVTISQE